VKRGRPSKPGPKSSTPTTNKQKKGKRLARGEAPKLILAALKKPMRVPDIHKSLSKPIGDNSLRAALASMAKQGVVKNDKGTWSKA
jgi:hypothetical protein